MMSTGVPIEVFVENHDWRRASPTRKQERHDDRRRLAAGPPRRARGRRRSGSSTPRRGVAQAGVTGGRDLAVERAEQVVGPLGEVLDPRRHALGVQRDAVDVHRRLDSRSGRDTVEEALGAGVRHHDVPAAVDDDRRVRVVGPDQLGERPAHARHRLAVERRLRVPRRVPGGEQHRVALPQRDVEVLGEGQHQLRRRLRLAGLDEAEVAGRHPDVERQVHLAAAAVLPPVPQHRADARCTSRPRDRT